MNEKYLITQVLTELKAYNYDLDYSISICRKLKNDEGLAYLLDKAGMIIDSLNLHLDVIKTDDTMN